MSVIDYKQSLKIAANDYSFKGIIMAAMRKADSYNLERLKREWPEIWNELFRLYNTPGILEHNFHGFPCDRVDEL